ncbi:MAG: RhuM family protein [Candidatus Gracilibacteria bacterium]
MKRKDESLWLSQKSMAKLFDCTSENVLMHLKNIYETGELSGEATTKNFLVVQKEGDRDVSRTIKHYNLDAIISVGYRVNSFWGTQFRIWATQRLKEYLLQGFTLNEEKLKSGKTTEYFDKLQARLREIRLSERVFYQKIKDIYTTRLGSSARAQFLLRIMA